jgi:hypothetical protein
MQTQTHETSPRTKSERMKRVVLAAKLIGAAGVASAAGLAYYNTLDYGYHPDRNPRTPTYDQINDGINPANIIRNSDGK